eukprot:610518-Rhodomonas_salina.1
MLSPSNEGAVHLVPSRDPVCLMIARRTQAATCTRLVQRGEHRTVPDEDYSDDVYCTAARVVLMLLVGQSGERCKVPDREHEVVDLLRERLQQARADRRREHQQRASHPDRE